MGYHEINMLDLMESLATDLRDFEAGAAGLTATDAEKLRVQVRNMADTVRRLEGRDRSDTAGIATDLRILCVSSDLLAVTMSGPSRVSVAPGPLRDRLDALRRVLANHLRAMGFAV